MSAALEPLSGQPVTLIPRPVQIALPLPDRGEVPYEIRLVYVMSGVITVPVYDLDELADPVQSDRDGAAAPK